MYVAWESMIAHETVQGHFELTGLELTARIIAHFRQQGFNFDDSESIGLENLVDYLFTGALDWGIEAKDGRCSFSIAHQGCMEGLLQKGGIRQSG